MKLVNQWRQNNEAIVFTNGCFDILHLGHVDYLERAKGLGNRLIVGVNSDRSVQGLKGKGRPVVDQESRLRVIAALEAVDALTVFDEETPFNLIKAIKPDILVKGNDYLAENIVGADIVKELGGKVVTLDLIAGYSTTKIIDRIKNTQ